MKPMVMLKVEIPGLPPYLCGDSDDAAEFIFQELDGENVFVDENGRATGDVVTICAVEMTPEEVAALPEWAP